MKSILSVSYTHLNQIRDLLGRDIDDALVRLELLSSIVAKDYLEE